jgi:hypothetical protein
MKRLVIALAIIMCSVIPANADTYTWTDDKGTANFTDDPSMIPLKYRVKAKKADDITLRNPKVQQELKEQEERARQVEIDRQRIVPTPDNMPSPQPPPAAAPPKPASDELPPGRPKSQRIRENIERREVE